jgi:hypothetical protein
MKDGLSPSRVARPASCYLEIVEPRCPLESDVTTSPPRTSEP